MLQNLALSADFLIFFEANIMITHSPRRILIMFIFVDRNYNIQTLISITKDELAADFAQKMSWQQNCDVEKVFQRIVDWRKETVNFPSFPSVNDPSK